MLALAVLLFIVMDPFGNLVTINAILSKYSTKERQIIILRESLIAAVILLASVFGGGAVLGLLGLEPHSLSISGGIVLFLIALGMLFPSRRMLEESSEDPPLVVPIAMPLIAGPSAISIVVLFAQEHPLQIVTGAVLLSSVASACLLLLSPWIFGFLGRRGSSALEKLMGMILIMISVQMVLNGLNEYLALRE